MHVTLPTFLHYCNLFFHELSKDYVWNTFHKDYLFFYYHYAFSKGTGMDKLHQGFFSSTI